MQQHEYLKIFQQSSSRTGKGEIPEQPVELVSWQRKFDSFSLICHTSLGRRVHARLDILHGQVFRFRLSAEGTVSENRTPMLVKRAWGRVSYKFEDKGDLLEFRFSSMILRMYKNPWRWEVRTLAGELVTGQQINDRDFVNKDRADAPFESNSISFAPIDKSYCTYESLILGAQERIYGFGEHYGPFDKRGQRIEPLVRDAVGTLTSRQYKPVPLYLSDKGYGLFFHSAYPASFSVGADSNVSMGITHDAPFIDYFFMYGPSFKKIIDLYTDITGKSPLPPKWSFGLWMSRCGYQNRDEALETAQRLRKEQVPCDVLHFDPPWLASFPKKMGNQCDFEINKEAFPDFKGMITELHDMGFKACLWENPYLARSSVAYQHNPGMYPKTTEGKDAAPIHNADFTLYDFTNKKTIAWHRARHQNLMNLGVDAFKTDYGEAAPVDARYADGTNGKAMHNLYPLLYNSCVFRETEHIHGRGLIWGRSSFAGGQRYPLYWAGDSNASFDGMAATLRGGMSLALSGFPFWSNDIGGFIPEHHDAVLYTRWAQFGLLCSHARCHGLGPHEPWAFGEQALEIFKTYARLRYRLMPYLYTCAFDACETGMPLLRPLVLEFQNDPGAGHVEDQFMLGPSLMVAPLFNHADEREVYLPEGSWYDFYTGECLEGRRYITYAAPLERLPLFVRDNTILPMGTDMQQVTEGLPDTLTLMCHVSGNAAYAVRDDNDKVLVRVRCKENQSTVSINTQPRTVVLKVVSATPITAVTMQGKDIPRTAWTFDNNYVTITHLCTDRKTVFTLSVGDV